MMIDSNFIPLINQVVDDLVAGNFKKIAQDGRGGRLSAEEIQYAVEEYGRTLTPLPLEAISLIDGCKVENSNEWMLDIPLWTVEEGRSDLTLSVTLDLTHKPPITIDDLHVL